MGDPPAAAALAVVVMAKAAAPGQVKTRLIGPLSAEQAAAVHAAMLACVLERVGTHMAARRVMAVAEVRSSETNGPGASLRSAPGLGADRAGWEVVEQGEGDLGARLEHVWRWAGGGPVAFLGVDSPDVPAEALRLIPAALAANDAAVGAVSDGGYWTLAARRLEPALLRAIDWGTAAVYDQTLAAARRAGLSVSTLPAWHDVDEPADLAALRHRLTTVAEPALVRLRERLSAICETST